MLRPEVADTFRYAYRSAEENAYLSALAHGWATMGKHVPPAEMAALLHSEVSEFFEAYRANALMLDCDKIPGVKNVEEEFADIIIRIMHYARDLDIDVAGAIVKKLEYNWSRPYRHGNKLA